MGRGRVQMSDAIGSSDLHGYFDAKVAAVQAATANYTLPRSQSRARYFGELDSYVKRDWPDEGSTDQ
jgi:hypothetical protein